MSLPKARKNGKKSVSCPVETTIAVIGGRWKVLVIHHLLERPRRFGELSRLLEGVSARTLTRQLRELEACGVIHREVYQQIPPMVEYSLTPSGKQLEPILLAMHAWGETYGVREE
jgi:DNA-binding HxlR family transcriptional regulator